VSTRSKFERQLNFRQIGFAIKIPDVGRSLKPFDYVVGVPTNGSLRFIAIEAKKATGWTLNNSEILPHQIKALDAVENLAPYSAWLAIGFLDIPSMKLDHNRQKIDGRRKKEAFLIPWVDAKRIASDTSMSYGDIISIGDCAMEWRKVRKRYYKWYVPKSHCLFNKIKNS
jgi:hypothetical protein